MTLILRGIDSLEQHLIRVSAYPDDYRPDSCPACGRSGLWHHGYYGRQSDREHGGCDSLNPVPILRFPLPFLQSNLFNAARMSCAGALVSMAYSAGEAVLVMVLNGAPVARIEREMLPERRAIRRWKAWLDDEFLIHSSILKDLFPKLDNQSIEAFWSSCFKQMSLATAMFHVHAGREAVP